MATYKTPGVYVEEISTIPPSVAEVSTAIPAFIGHTEKGAPLAGAEPVVTRIDTLLEYENIFGKAKPGTFKVTTLDKEITRIERQTVANQEFLMHYSLSMYFKNGGGSCYVVSVDDYTNAPTRANLEKGLAQLEKEDEPTLIVLPDAVNLSSADHHSLCQAALAQCRKLGDRFAILDVREGDVEAFRDGIGTNNLMYGAAYHPYIRTSLSHRYAEDDIEITMLSSGSASNWNKNFGENGITVSYQGSADSAPKANIGVGLSGDAVAFAVEAQLLTISNVAGKTGAEVATAWGTWAASNATGGFGITQNGDGTGAVSDTADADVALDSVDATPVSLASIKTTETALYNRIKTELEAQRVTLPPGSTIAGIYAQVDRERGVWKAPANVSLSGVIGPVAKITREEQEGFNVHDTGKSINAIRAFSGKGTMVWGARTLAGNDNEWRYVNVRRLFNMIEESTQKATAFAVFEPNDANTWLKVKAMIESYLYGLWEQGALSGSTSDAAYFVNVGLGKTMTAQDVLDGRMIVEMGIAAVRPAEFIVLRFSHKMQEA